MAYAGKSAAVSTMPVNSSLGPRPLVDLSSSKKEVSTNRKSMMPNAAPTPAAERAYQAGISIVKNQTIQ